MAEENGAGRITYESLNTSLTWLKWGVGALATVGAFMVLSVRGELQQNRQALDRLEARVESSVRDLSGTISTSNSVLQDTTAKLAVVGQLLQRTSNDIQRHQDLPPERAHPRWDEEERRKR